MKDVQCVDPVFKHASVHAKSGNGVVLVVVSVELVVVAVVVVLEVVVLVCVIVVQPAASITHAPQSSEQPI